MRSFTGNVTHLKVCSGFLVYIMETRDTKVVRRVNMMSKTEERDGKYVDLKLQLQCFLYTENNSLFHGSISRTMLT